jgi:hypothetical protein
MTLVIQGLGHVNVFTSVKEEIVPKCHNSTGTNFVEDFKLGGVALESSLPIVSQNKIPTRSSFLGFLTRTLMTKSFQRRKKNIVTNFIKTSFR